MIERWKPKKGDVYYTISCFENDICDYCWDDDSIDKECWESGNCFKTEAEAQAASEKVKALLLSLHDNGETLQDSIQDKQLPDYCKVGEYVFDRQYGYGIVANSSATYCNVKFCDFSAEYHPDLFSELKQARLRPCNADEMKTLVGKVLEHENKASLVIACLENGLIRAGLKWVHAERLIEEGYTINGTPAGVLEHLENGEWIK